MLTFLFGSLTPAPTQGTVMFDAATRIARAPHWYVEGGVPDTLDGRFALLATVSALVMVRLETLGEAGDRSSVALTERFVEVMESEHRELGIGDPGLGKTVRKLVGALARRVDVWRAAVAGERDWADAVDSSVTGNVAGRAHLAEALRALSGSLEASGLDQLTGGDFG